MNENDELYKRLKNAASLYYSDNESPLTDAEYDKGVRELHTIANSMGAAYDGRWDDLFDTKIDAGGFNAGDNDVITHKLPMMSLAKAYHRSELDSYMKRLMNAGATGFKLQMKLDGMSMSCVYENGKLVQMSTRGNGTQGKDASHLINNPDVSIENLPLTLLTPRITTNATASNVNTTNNADTTISTTNNTSNATHDVNTASADTSNANDDNTHASTTAGTDTYTTHDNTNTASTVNTTGTNTTHASTANTNVDTTASIPNRLEVRGELLITRTHYHEASEARLKATGEAFNAIRNAGIGIVNAAREGLGYHATLTFIAYRIITDGDKPEDTHSMQALLSEYGFKFADEATREQWSSASTSVPELTVMLDDKHDANSVMQNVNTIVNDYGAIRGDFDMPNDGIVIKPVNEDEMNDKMGATAHHPSSQIAFKYAGEQVEVIVRNIEWSIGKQGHLTPTLVYDPVMLNGTRNDHATFHNASYLLDYDIRPGSHALIEQAGGVIPKFDDIVSSPTGTVRFSIPTSCPKCGHPIIMGDRIAECVNPDCTGRKSFILYNAVSSAALDIDGLGPSIIDAAMSAGMLTDVPSLFTLNENELSELSQPGGQRVGTRASVIISELDKARENAPFDRLTAALAIPGVAARSARLMMKQGINTLEILRSCSHATLTSITGIGDTTADAIMKWFKVNDGIVNRLQELGVKAAGKAGETMPVVSSAGNAGDGVSNASSTTGGVSAGSGYDPFVSGHSFSITGDVPEPFANRNAFRDYIEDNGGVFNPSPNKKTDYMIGDETSSSSKMVKAKAFKDSGSGIIIMTPSEFTASIRLKK
jgi:DNA ligase (NAD+)